MSQHQRNPSSIPLFEQEQGHSVVQGPSRPVSPDRSLSRLRSARSNTVSPE